MSSEISEVARRAIVDFIAVSAVDWAGRLPEDDFLARLYDLTAMGSTDHRMRTAAGDIHQHRVNWRDWEDDWVFYGAGRSAICNLQSAIPRPLQPNIAITL